ncbi:MAG: hypothetical protein O3A92_17010 [Verrucomicrobia bacterium]|nr:hypothetical protein [Verrucomicrobiota bacterium]
MDRLYELYDKEAVSVEEFKSKFQPLEESSSLLFETVARLEKEIGLLEADTATKAEIFEEGETLVAEWPKMTKKRKRTLVESLVERITVHKSRKVDFELNYVPGQSIVNSERKQ